MATRMDGGWGVGWVGWIRTYLLNYNSGGSFSTSLPGREGGIDDLRRRGRGGEELFCSESIAADII